MDDNNTLGSINNIDIDKIKIYLQEEFTPEHMADFLKKAYKTIPQLNFETHTKKDDIVSGYSIDVISPTILKFSFPVQLSEGETYYNIFINHCEDIPSGQIVWDYFGSGECYCNLNLVNLESAKSSFSVLYGQYMVSPSKLGTQPTQAGLTPFDFVTSAYAPSGNMAWSLNISTFFKYSKKNVDYPVCVYFTHKNANTNIVSKHFKFANVPNNVCSCSHPNVSTERNKFSPCHFSMTNNECPLYVDDSKIVFSQDINPINTDSIISFDMSYSLTSSGSHLFKIRNTTNKILINTLKYPSDNSYDTCFEEALRIFNEYTSVYSSDSSITEVKRELSLDADKDIAKSSYIESLITA